MDILYQELFRIRCQHEYHGGDCPVLSLRPTPECERMLKRYRCRFRPAASGGSVWYGAHEGVSLLPGFQEYQAFSFVITNADPDLGLYTDLGPSPPAPDQTLYWYHNLEGHPVDQDGKRILVLHPPDDAIRTLPVKGPVFRHKFDAPQAASVLSVVNATDPEMGMQADAPPDPFRVCSLDLSTLPDGRYRLRLDGEEKLHFVLSARSPTSQWGLIEIYARGPQPPVPEACRVIDENGDAQPKSFQIALAAQRTTWRYFVIAQPRKGQSESPDYGKHKVVGKPGPAFDLPKKTKFAGKDAWMFQSSVPIALYAHPRDLHSFRLLAKHLNDDAGGIKLPYASPATTRVRRENDRVRLVSDVIQYL